MGTTQEPMPAAGPRQRAVAAAGYLWQRAATVVGYPLLLVLGALQGLIGSFQYSRSPAPLIAIVLAVAIFVTCAGCGWGFGTFGAALLPAVGWIIVSFVLASPRSNGSVLITATAAGEWYLYGGALGCAAGCFIAFFARIRRGSAAR